MKMHMIASVYADNQRIGFRILDSDTGKIIDVPDQSIIQVIKSGQSINNLEISEGKLRGSNGDITRYAKLVNGKLGTGEKSPLVILNQLGDTGYTISDHLGQIKKAKTEVVVDYALKNGIANGKISNRDGKQFISAIYGNYEKIDIQPQTQSSVSSPIKTKDITEVSEEDTGISLSFTDEQRGILKDYYSWANLNPDVANKEIEYLDRILKENKLEAAYKCTTLLYEMLTKLGSSFNIGNAFGNELGGKLACFVSVKLPFPKSLVFMCAQHIQKDIKAFYNILFNEMHEAIDLIFKADRDTMGIAAKLYLEYMATREILGKYKGFDTEKEAKQKEFIKEYGICTTYTFTELRAIIGAIDLIKEFEGEIQSVLDRRLIYAHKKELFYVATQYIKAETSIYGSPSREEKIALLETIGFYPEYYDRDALNYLNRTIVMQDKTLDESPIEDYPNCLFVSTPLTRQEYLGYEPEKSIEDIYAKQILALNIGNSLILGRFNQFLRNFYNNIDEENRRRDKEELDRIARESHERAEKAKIEHREPAKEKTEQAGEITESTEDKSSKTDESLAGLNKMQLDIREGKDLSIYDRVDLYKELKSQAKGPFTDICFTIADDMIRRKLRYMDMSKKQKFRFDEAISKLTEEVTGKKPVKAAEDKQAKGSKPSKEDKTVTEVNNTYELDKHPEIQKKVEELQSKADSVEMSAVLSEEPNVLKICYSIIKYKKASDRQLKHIDRAIELLHNQ